MDFTRVTGKITAVSPMKTKTGDTYYKIQVTVDGKQYPIKGSTFDNALEYTGDQVLDLAYSERDSGTPNPHKPVQNFINKTFYLPNHVKSAKAYQPSQPQASRPIQNQQPQAGTVPADLITKIHALTKKVDELEQQIIELQTGQRPQGAVQTVLPPDHEEQGEPSKSDNIPF